MNGSLLIVDDEPFLRQILENFFGLLSYRVRSVSSRDTAEAALATERFDVVVTDLRLGGTDDVSGLDVARYVREKLPETLVVMITGYATDEVRSEARDLGVDILGKPFELDELERFISKRIDNERRLVAS